MKNLTKEKLRDMLRQETIKSLKKHNEILQPLEINFDSDLDDNEIDGILGRNNVPGIILGKRNKDIIKLPFDSFFNKNISVFGSSGSMKTIRFSYH